MARQPGDLATRSRLSPSVGCSSVPVSSPAELIRIVIADSHPIFRDGLHRLLETDPAFRIMGETGTGSEAATLARDRGCDVLLLDFAPRRPARLETLRSIAASGGSVRTIILADSIDDPDLPKALQAGAHGVVLTDAATEVLFTSIRSVMAGHYWIASDALPDLSTSLRKLETERRSRRAFGLTHRELEIVRMVVAGYTNKEIAQKSSIGENTVKSHLTHIFNKLGASNRVELALFAAHHRLFDDR
jgi:two-component system, NarL family, nitrate/nitrite response regulator NarL